VNVEFCDPSGCPTRLQTAQMVVHQCAHWTRTIRTLATFSALLLVATLTHAGPVDDCNQVRHLSRQLRGCTAYIRQRKATPEMGDVLEAPRHEIAAMTAIARKMPSVAKQNRHTARKRQQLADQIGLNQAA
jgi:hypothetical protein